MAVQLTIPRIAVVGDLVALACALGARDIAGWSLAEERLAAGSMPPPTLAQAPQPGEFSREAALAGRKADLIVGLWDHRVMPIECKVSNSSINSIKRLNNDAAAKAEAWLTDLGKVQIVPVAVLSGVYGLHSLESAQRRGLTLSWAHRLSDLTAWIERTRL